MFRLLYYSGLKHHFKVVRTLTKDIAEASPKVRSPTNYEEAVVRYSLTAGGTFLIRDTYAPNRPSYFLAILTLVFCGILFAGIKKRANIILWENVLLRLTAQPVVYFDVLKMCIGC